MRQFYGRTYSLIAQSKPKKKRKTRFFRCFIKIIFYSGDCVTVHGKRVEFCILRIPAMEIHDAVRYATPAPIDGVVGEASEDGAAYNYFTAVPAPAKTLSLRNAGRNRLCRLTPCRAALATQYFEQDLIGC